MRRTGVWLTCLLLASLCVSQALELDDNEPMSVDTILFLEGEHIWTMTQSVREGPFWISFQCPSESSCEELNLTVEDSTGASFVASGRFSAELTGTVAAGDVSITMERDGETTQHLEVSMVFMDFEHGEYGDAPSHIPNPGESSDGWPTMLGQGCQTLVECSSVDRTELDPAAIWWNGSLDDEEDSDAILLNGSVGDLHEVVFATASTNLRVEVWERSADDLTQTGIITIDEATWGQRVILSNEMGETWLVVSSMGGEGGLYSIRHAHHSSDSETEGGETPSTTPGRTADDYGSYSGHLSAGDEDLLLFPAGSRSRISLSWTLSTLGDVKVEARSQTWQSLANWTLMEGQETIECPVGTDLVAISFSNTTGGAIWTLDSSHQGPDDGGELGDASDAHPTGEASTLGWAKQTGGSGSFTGTIGSNDTRDVYLIERELGHADRSILSVTMTTMPGCCDVKIVKLNTSSYYGWSTEAWNKSNGSGQQSTVTLNLPHGRHLIVVESESSEESYQIDYVWLELEKEEEIDPSDYTDLSDSFNLFYAIIGILFLAPGLLVLYWHRRDGGALNLQRHEVNRLHRLRERLAEANPEDDADPNALLHALESLADTDWEALITEWGEPKTRHMTDSVDIAIWVVSSADEKTSVALGIATMEDEWNRAGIRFQAIEGPGWEVESVTPECLTNQDEIYLGDLKRNSRRFLRVDLTGDCEGFDLMLTGMIAGEPITAVPTRAAIVEEE